MQNSQVAARQSRPRRTAFDRLRQGWSFVAKVILTQALLVGLPAIFYYGLQRGGVVLTPLHRLIATLYLLSSLWLIVETAIASFRRFAVQPKQRQIGFAEPLSASLKASLGIHGAELPEPSRPVPRCSFIVAAYLPNEQDIIMTTVHHLLRQIQRPAAGMEVILAYNTPVALPLEQTLRQLAQAYPSFRLLWVEDSQSKAENINAALQIVSGEVTCILDADHHPAIDCWPRAWRWLDQGYDVVQGRNVIRNYRQNWLTGLIALEFDSIYSISHSAKSLIMDMSVFGGSNGYWRTEVLRQVRFNPTMLTEDIDASVRTLLQGYRIVHDRSIVVTELAPATLKGFWSQRKRWAQGWLEISVKYQRRFWKSGRLSAGQKVFWTYLLYYRELFPLLAMQTLPMLASLWLLQGSLGALNQGYLWVTTEVTVLSIVLQTLVISKLAATRYPLGHFLRYVLLTPFYATLKNAIATVALYDHLKGQTDWVVTPRDVPVPASAEPPPYPLSQVAQTAQTSRS